MLDKSDIASLLQRFIGFRFLKLLSRVACPWVVRMLPLRLELTVTLCFLGLGTLDGILSFLLDCRRELSIRGEGRSLAWVRLGLIGHSPMV